MLADKMISLRALLFDLLWVEWVDDPMGDMLLFNHRSVNQTLVTSQWIYHAKMGKQSGPARHKQAMIHPSLFEEEEEY